MVTRIDFDSSPMRHDADVARVNGEVACELMKSLIGRKAIPEARIRFFTDPQLNVGGRGSSRRQIFEKHGTSGDAIFRHPHFLKYLRYFLFGPDLPAAVIEGFQEKVALCQPVTSGDIDTFVEYARQQTRLHRLDAGTAAEEFYKLALECGLHVEARIIRDAVKRLR